MINPRAVVRRHLAGKPAVVAALPGGIYAGASLPPGYTVQRGPALLLAERGGSPGYDNAAWRVSLQFRVYAASAAAAQAAAGAVCDAINDTRGGSLSWLRLEPGTVPSLLTEPGSGWAYILMFFEAHVRQEV